jgi:hypothetical protein
MALLIATLAEQLRLGIDYAIVPLSEHCPKPAQRLHRLVREILTDRPSGQANSAGGSGDKLDPARRKFAHLRHDPNGANSVSSAMIWTFCEDRGGVIWIGACGGGLNRRDRAMGQWTHYRLGTGLEEMFGLRGQQKGLALRFEIAPDLPRFVRTDEGKLRQALMNLLQRRAQPARFPKLLCGEKRKLMRKVS